MIQNGIFWLGILFGTCFSVSFLGKSCLGCNFTFFVLSKEARCVCVCVCERLILSFTSTERHTMQLGHDLGHHIPTSGVRSVQALFIPYELTILLEYSILSERVTAAVFISCQLTMQGFETILGVLHFNKNSLESRLSFLGIGVSRLYNSTAWD